MPTSGFPAVTEEVKGAHGAHARSRRPAGTATEAALAWSGDPLLTSKVSVPALPGTCVPRQRLLDRLSSGANGPLTLIAGPAGAGKTTLASSWAHLAVPPGPVAWLTLDPDDNAPGVFWSYVLEALRRALPSLPATIGTPTSPDSIGRSLLVRLASAVEHLPHPVVLVLDDMAKAPGREVSKGLGFLLEHAGPQLRLVLISRVDPRLPLHRYRAEDRLTEIRGADLAFTSHEAATLLRQHDPATADSTVRALTSRTEGWAAGLRLCALAMRNSDDPEGFAQSFAASEHAVSDYLLAEVLDAQPAATRELLLRTSILDQVHPELANALTGRQDAEQILARLVHDGAFVEPVAGTRWCHVHPLFAKVLQAHLRARRPGLAPRLHSRAARWLADAGRPAEALGHATAAGDWQYGAAEAVRNLMIGPLLAGTDEDRLPALFSRMPDDTPGAEPALVAGACRLARRDPGGCRERLTAAERYMNRGNTPLGPEAGLTHALLRLLCESYGPESGATPGAAAEETARDADDLTARVARWRTEKHPEIKALRLHGLACALLRSGRLDDARQAFTDAVAACTDDATHLVLHASFGKLALTESAVGALTAAEDHAVRSLAVADRHGVSAARRSGAGHLALAVLAFEREDPRGARHHLEQAMACPDTRDDPVMAAESAVLRSRLELAQGRWAAALTTLGEPGPPPMTWPAERLAVARSHAALAHGDHEAAVSALHGGDGDGPALTVALAQAHLAAGRTDRALRLVAHADRSHRLTLSDHVRIRLLRARIAMLGDDPTAAHDPLAQALEAARPEQLRRPFTEAGPWLRHLLDRADGEGGARLSRSWLTTRRPDGPRTPAFVEPLSGREREVLACVARMLSTDEIAGELHLSVNTVKTHLRSVYRKLCVSRRREAVELGKELHLL
ncbi:LuxR C-terminal-related transcriptional regulator [Streptomyces netropsis]|uniref:LuxR family maltose regulon positive regulatory protein n=1 Tax=Streptomyces netropsis TaxID=55404 RepID=A0A7W7PG28_STRNE|nr:LuxR C-terminal-related transcriptional regulator [Streptomyces netropsis]MBB4887315.1 LuxR family maltose regulon positive regulatory protein [Streptomyces netropsis]GGR09409.1 transcriptional regulator [Streptomyces netropsis]